MEYEYGKAVFLEWYDQVHKIHRLDKIIKLYKPDIVYKENLGIKNEICLNKTYPMSERAKILFSLLDLKEYYEDVMIFEDDMLRVFGTGDYI